MTFIGESRWGTIIRTDDFQNELILPKFYKRIVHYGKNYAHLLPLRVHSEEALTYTHFFNCNPYYNTDKECVEIL